MHKGKAYAVPYQVSPWPLVTRLDLLEAAKVDPPKTWDELIESARSCRSLPSSPASASASACKRCR